MRHLRKMRLIIFILSILVCADSATAAARWNLLGSRTVTDRADHDEITVTGARGDFRRIKLTVRQAGVDFHRVVVHYATGGDEEVDLRQTVPAGGETRSIDLRGGDRIIRKVTFWYDAKSRGRRAVVSLYGWG